MNPVAILGALIITILSNGMNMIGVDPYIQNIVKGVVLVGDGSSMYSPQALWLRDSHI